VQLGPDCIHYKKVKLKEESISLFYSVYNQDLIALNLEKSPSPQQHPYFKVQCN